MTLHSLKVLGMNGDKWERACESGSEIWKGNFLVCYIGDMVTYATYRRRKKRSISSSLLMFD